MHKPISLPLNQLNPVVDALHDSICCPIAKIITNPVEMSLNCSDDIRINTPSLLEPLFDLLLAHFRAQRLLIPLLLLCSEQNQRTLQAARA